MKILGSECACPAAAVLAEGPVWHEDALWWVDIERGEVHRLDPVSGADRAWPLGMRVGFAVPTERGDFLVGTPSGLGRFDPTTGDLKMVVNPEADRPGNRFNDAKCDPGGRLWAGTMAINERAGQGSLYRVEGGEGDWRITRLVEGVSISNGLAWSPDRQTMYYIDSPTRRVDAFVFRDGAISGRRTVVTLTDGFPDGMCVDAVGNLWIALWGGWGVACHDPRTGQRLAKVEVPVEAVSSCCFGRDDALWITTSSRDLDAAGRTQQPLAGGIFRALVGVTAPKGNSALFREIPAIVRG